MPLTGVEHGFRVNHGIHEGSNTKLCIVREDTKLKAKLLRDGRDVTTECAASAFVWKKNGSAAGTGKEIAVTTAEINGDVQFSCTYTETQGVYGTVQVNNNLVASHTPASADANHTFSLVNGMLNVEVPNSAGNGTDYELTDGVLSVNPGFTGSITAEYEFTTSPTREIDFKYDHNGMRTAKIVVENGVTVTYDYTLHGKLITHLTKRTVDENGTENTEELHFFYDAQNKPAFVEFDGAMYRYVHNLQGDIVAIVDAAGNFVVEYKYDAWGKPTSTTGSLKTSLGELNPFRYRGYVWNAESSLYYLKSRYYCVILTRFVNADDQVTDPNRITDDNLFAYCSNNPIIRIDPTGKAWWHWVVGAAIVVACAAAVVVTAGGAMAGVAAVSAVANGMAATSTAATIASGAFIGSSIVYGAEVITAASESTSIEDFNQRGNWNTIFSTAGGAALGAANGYYLAKNSKIVYRSRGSTGRKTPLNLREQLGMKQVQSNPLAGARRLPVPMTDPRWPAKEGWVKMANNVNGIEIHFVYNPIRGYFDDFKFK